MEVRPALDEDFSRASLEDGGEHPAAPAPGDQLGLGLEEDDYPQPKVNTWNSCLAG